MKKFWNILVLMVFVNFLAAPAIALVFGVELPQTNLIISEEETHSGSLTLFEKTVPDTLNVHDFIKFFTTVSHKGKFVLYDDPIHLTPYLSIFSPPPEV